MKKITAAGKEAHGGQRGAFAMLTGSFSDRKTNSYLPLQPGLENNPAYYTHTKRIRDPNSRSVVLYYQFKTSKNVADATMVVPDGCIDIIFCCSPGKPIANCYGTVLQCSQTFFEADCEYVGVRYLPEQAIHLMKELVNNSIPLQDLISTEACILERVGNAKTFEEKIKVLEKTINKQVIQNTNVPGLIKYSIERIYLSNGNTNLDQLAKETGYSARYLRKKFDDLIGISPKLFSQIVRFQNSLNMIIDMSEIDLWDIVSENGYCDQAHFINQFKKFCNLTPKRFMKTFAKRSLAVNQ